MVGKLSLARWFCLPIGVLLALGLASESKPPLIPSSTPVADLGTNTKLPAHLEEIFRVLPSPPPPIGFLAFKKQPGATALLFYPLDQPALDISPFNWRYSESRKGWRMHAGLDLMAPEGEAIRPVKSGRVVLVDTISGYGITVVVAHGELNQSLYAHLSAVDVKPGDQVEPSSLLGRVGQTGVASGPHLHFEWRERQGNGWVALDPMPLMVPK
ncbi:MAG: M23 family metallopeptidase [Synechococcaceae bacterium WBA_2_066]|nr:M23 family metallopeptidase [Synechococcaceae bacterium WB6_1A_059]NBP32410.1 M23 family metallopeptidase [Synechococcaceae bacterium WB6_1B_055]NBQ19384.1 M23 family metallopeptidase [Synechococcaceae bacterium WB5_2A_257]NBR44574.1 M23 family metallopeptidase [Synechococcaceae bacterium WB5_2B_268]NCU75867.1 M23 family metallopeptidase [Synechococcaceae bacterium WB7_1C_051]NCU91337.1 M23 family metallopeptidase [Synechococcaceae bacterium WB7_1B_046]NCY13385.1 M23 family metallopeptidas